MNGNEPIIILVAIIGVPICIWALIWMPNASKCWSCGLALNIHRQKTYHKLIENKNVEVCKRCYRTITPAIALKEVVEKRAQIGISNENSTINIKHENIKPKTRSKNSLLQLSSPLIEIGESISISEVLKEIKDNKCVWLDTETTGLSSNDKVIELSICTHDKQVIFNSILRSEVECTKQARAVHGITDEQIANGMAVESAKESLVKVLEGKTVISFNADFDCKMLFQTLGLSIKKRFCVMKWSQSVLDYERWPRLEKVCERLNIEQKKTEAHRALTDTFTTIDVFNKLVDLTSNYKSLLRDFSLIDLKILNKLENEETLFLSPNSNTFSFDRLIDRYGNDIIGIRSRALKRMLKKEATRIFIENSSKGKTLKVQYISEPEMRLPITKEELWKRLDGLKLKKNNPNKYLSLKATVSLANINKTIDEVISGTYYFPSISINAGLYESLDNLPIFHNRDRGRIVFTIKTPKNTIKKLFALGLQGYSSILKVLEYDNKVTIIAYQLLDGQKITILNKWELGGEKS